MNSTGDIEKRIQRLERENRVLKRLGLVLLVVIGTGLTMGQATRVSGVIEGEKFVLKDPGGNVRGIWGFTTDKKHVGPPNQVAAYPELCFFDTKGRPGIQIGVSVEGAGTENEDSYILLYDNKAPKERQPLLLGTAIDAEGFYTRGPTWRDGIAFVREKDADGRLYATVEVGEGTLRIMSPKSAGDELRVQASSGGKPLWAFPESQPKRE